jgi:hypothetical protein
MNSIVTSSKNFYNGITFLNQIRTYLTESNRYIPSFLSNFISGESLNNVLKAINTLLRIFELLLQLFLFLLGVFPLLYSGLFNYIFPFIKLIFGYFDYINTDREKKNGFKSKY